jgi:hypothetical protein
MSVRVEINNVSEIYAMSTGMKVFLDTGEEIKDITAFSMPTTHVDNVMCVTLTIPVSDIKFIKK